MRQEAYVFSKEDARNILRESREAKQAAFRAQRELEKIRYQFGYAQNVNNIEYYLPTTTLQPGGSCTGILQVWDRSVQLVFCCRQKRLQQHHTHHSSRPVCAFRQRRSHCAYWPNSTGEA